MRDIFKCRDCDAGLEVIFVINEVGILKCNTCGTLYTGPNYRAVIVALQEMLATSFKVDDVVWAKAIERAGTCTPCDHALFALEGYTDWLGQYRIETQRADVSFP